MSLSGEYSNLDKQKYNFGCRAARDTTEKKF